jgi:hypothetical protein
LGQQNIYVVLKVNGMIVTGTVDRVCH